MTHLPPHLIFAAHDTLPTLEILPMNRRSSQRALVREIYRQMVAQAPSAPPQNSRAAQNLTEKVRALYEHSAVPVAEIARLAGVTERTIYKYAARENWTPRYRWNAAGGRSRGARWRSRAVLAPAKGAAGRFIRRADKGKPFAIGLKAADPHAAAGAGVACGRAAALARVAQAKAELVQREEATIRAIDTVDKAFAELNRYRAARAKAGQPGLRDDDRVAQLLVRMAEIAAARLQRLLPA